MRYRNQFHGPRTWHAGTPKSIGSEVEELEQD